MYHFRDRGGAEVDVVFEAGHGRVAGVLLHTGDRRLRLGDRLVALPASDVWT